MNLTVMIQILLMLCITSVIIIGMISVIFEPSFKYNDEYEVNEDHL